MNASHDISSSLDIYCIIYFLRSNYYFITIIRLNVIILVCVYVVKPSSTVAESQPEEK